MVIIDVSEHIKSAKDEGFTELMVSKHPAFRPNKYTLLELSNFVYTSEDDNEEKLESTPTPIIDCLAFTIEGALTALHSEIIDFINGLYGFNNVDSIELYEEFTADTKEIKYCCAKVTFTSEETEIQEFAVVLSSLIHNILGDDEPVSLDKL